MDLFILFSVLITIAAFFSYLNIRFLKLPSGISLMIMGSITALGMIFISYFFPAVTHPLRERLAQIDFSEFLLGVLLSFLLFAGSLHVQLADLKKSAKVIITFASVGTLISTAVVGIALYYLTIFIALPIPFLYCLLFGALISPTDPIAVMGILKEAGLSKDIETKIVGESLINDGIGVVIFVTILQIVAVGHENFGVIDITLLFLQEAVGGVVTGLLIGYAGFILMKSIDHFQTEILISLAMVMGGYSFCHYIHVSGPLAMVVAGIITGNTGAAKAMSDNTRDYLGKFWEVTDEILNAILFMLIGLEIVFVDFRVGYILISIITVVLIVLSRFISLYGTSLLFRFKQEISNNTLKIMTWGGLRGGISIALALSIPPNPYKELIVSITFVIVLVSIVGQGLTIERFIKHINRKAGG